MHLLLTPAFDIAYRDIQSFELKDDLLYVFIKGNDNARIFTNGAQRLKEIKALKDIHHLHDFLQKNRKSKSSLAREMGLTPQVIIKLFNNNHLSKDLKEKIDKKYPGIFDE